MSALNAPTDFVLLEVPAEQRAAIGERLGALARSHFAPGLETLKGVEATVGLEELARLEREVVLAGLIRETGTPPSERSELEQVLAGTLVTRRQHFESVCGALGVSAAELVGSSH